jgi:hypothetical protein
MATAPTGLNSPSDRMQLPHPNSGGSPTEHPLQPPLLLAAPRGVEEHGHPNPLVPSPELTRIEVSSDRCSERGCVFPAAWRDGGRCRQHDRQSREPALFSSQQPSTLLLDRAKFGLPGSDSEPYISRSADRRRLTKLWQAFLDGAV